MFTSYNLAFCQREGNAFVEGSSNTMIDPLFKLLCVQYNNAPDWGRYNTLILDGGFSTDVITSIITNTIQYPTKMISTQYTPKNTTLQAGVIMRAQINN